jgi:hypothetical protein
MKYLLLFCGNPQDREAWETLPDETRAQHSIRVGQWFAEHRSQIRSSNQFSESYTATTVFFPPGGRPLVLDGPFEGTGVIDGSAEIEVADLDEALQLAETWPFRWPAHSVVEIRPLVELE